jgi:hypothetical protein
MSTLGELLRSTPLPVTSAQPLAVPAVLSAEADIQALSSPPASMREGQIHALVHQLFLHPEAERVRGVGFAPVEVSPQTGPLCFDVAKALALEGRYDVGLIDASGDALSLQSHLQVPSPSRPTAAWPLASRLWLVPQESWRRGAGLQTVTDSDIDRLREFMTGFDFSVLYCTPMSWLTLKIATACDGLVLVLIAGQTRRLVAAQIREQLRAARIPLLGTVLAQRRLPVPEALYRRL